MLLPHVYRPAQEITYTPLTLAADAIVQQTPPEDHETADDAQPSGGSDAMSQSATAILSRRIEKMATSPTLGGLWARDAI
jgi:uncharacterized protein with beta-barrel porin domain